MEIPHPNWKDVHRPDLHWAPSGLPGKLKSVPGWLARGVAEGRFVVDVAAMAARSASPLGGSDPGEPAPGHVPAPVLVIPGFGFGDPSTIPLRRHLSDRGFEVETSGIFMNVDCGDRTVLGQAEVAERIAHAHGGRIDVVGQSRGGMVARGLAARRPDLVRRAISLGSPLVDEFAFYELPGPIVAMVKAGLRSDPRMAGRQCVSAECGCPYMEQANAPLPANVELVSMFSKSDGVVDWRSCVVPGAVNVEVHGPHLGMGFKRQTLDTIVDALLERLPGQRVGLR